MEVPMADFAKQWEKLSEENRLRVSKYVDKLLTLQRMESRLNGQTNSAEYELKKIDPEFVQDIKGARCSFCGKSQYRVERMIAGSNVYICNECVELCDEVLQDAKNEEEGSGE